MVDYQVSQVQLLQSAQGSGSFAVSGKETIISQRLLSIDNMAPLCESVRDTFLLVIQPLSR